MDDEETDPMTQTQSPLVEPAEGPAQPEVAAAKRGGKKAGAKARARRLRRWLVACAVALVLTLAGLGVAIGFAVSGSGGGGSASDALRQSALDTAKRYALDFSTYDYRTIDADFARISAELTPSFRTQYQTTSASLKSIVVQYRGVATATVQGIGLTSITGSQAVVVVFLDQQVTNSSTKTPRIDRNRLQITLLRNGGGWLMSDLQLK
ncbi:MAG TPA: hypothetical protein VKQ07_08405 [Jatrophihabitantaceae bacterium]|nr:hypothetical protein [Jatrophihabitantaceae bacterium]